jgi:23S rRNA (pseudouridine1915-N3)-methyltransferase
VRLLALAVGRMKAGPERDLMQRYDERARASARALGMSGPDWRDIDESRARRADDRKAEEAKALLALIPSGARLFALDERGKHMTSPDLAAQIGRCRDQAVSDCVFIIGGADGLDEQVRAQAQTILSFGALTWPHQLVRVMLSEQIYRCMMILSGHPYHRV